MLDLIITYLNFFIIAIKYIVKIIAFQPPDPKGYRIKYFNNDEKRNNNKLEIKSGDIIEILFALKNNSKNENEKNNKNDLKKTNNEEKNKEIIIKRKQKYEYRPATNTYASYELRYIDNEDNNTIIPVFLFKAYKGYDCGVSNNTIKNYLVIYCHGNSGDIGTSFMECQYLSHNLSCNVLCFEYPGYGLSTDINNTNEKRSYFNIRQAYKYARNKLNYKPKNIIIYGFSLGTGIAFDLACDKNYPIGGVILQSAFLSIIRTIYNFKKTYYFDLFNNCDKAKYCNSKIYFIHGDKDTIVPYVHGRILSKLIPKEYFCGFYTVPGANHNDILKFASRNLYETIINFIISLDEDKFQSPDAKSSDSYLSNIVCEKPNTIKNEYESRINYDLNEIKNITSNDELNIELQGEKENNNQLFNKISQKKKNSINKCLEKNEENNNNKGEEEKRDEDKLKNENENKGTIFQKKEDSKIEEPIFLDSKDIKINIDNHNNNSISKFKYNNNSKFNDINNKNSNSSDSNDLSISFDKK